MPAVQLGRGLLWKAFLCTRTRQACGFRQSFVDHTHWQRETNSSSSPGWPDDTEPLRPGGHDFGVSAETVRNLCQQGQLHEAVDALEGLLQAVQVDSRVSKTLLYTVLKNCAVRKDVVLGRRLHTLMVKMGYHLDTFLCNHILRMYASHASLQEAMAVFTSVATPDAFMWSSIISAHVRHGQAVLAIELYHGMRRSRVKPDGHVFVAALQACARAADLKSGQLVHADVLAAGGEPDVFVCSCLVDMYAKCGSLEQARSVFDRLPEKNVVTWTSLILGYSQQGMGQEALRLYSDMRHEGVAAPNSVTYVCLLQACASVGFMALETGKRLHAQIGEQGLHSNMFVANSLVNMYAKCGSLEEAQSLFEGLGRKDVVTWNAMIAGYAQQGMVQEALRLHRAMQQGGGASPNSVTFVCLLQTCANVAALHPGRQLHAEIVQQGLQADVFVAISLINMYAKSGSMLDAQVVFDALPERDDVAWNALIAGYTRQGNSAVVLDLVHRMREDGLQPNGITFLSVLTVCSHAGLVTQGREYFEAMSGLYSIPRTIEHYACIVDLLGRAGHLDEALAVVRAMPLEPHAAVWRTLLSACRKWGNVEVGRHAFDEAVKLDETDAAPYVLMSNLYTSAHMWEQAEEMQARRIGIGAWKQPGQSWWTDIHGQVHSFLVGDKSHQESEGIYALLQHLVPKNEEPGVCPISRISSTAGHI